MRIWTEVISPVTITVVQTPHSVARKWRDDCYMQGIRSVVLLVSDHGEIYRHLSVRVREVTKDGGIGIAHDGQVIEFLDSQVVNFVSVRPNYPIEEDLVS